MPIECILKNRTNQDTPPFIACNRFRVTPFKSHFDWLNSICDSVFKANYDRFSIYYILFAKKTSTITQNPLPLSNSVNSDVIMLCNCNDFKYNNAIKYVGCIFYRRLTKIDWFDGTIWSMIRIFVKCLPIVSVCYLSASNDVNLWKCVTVAFI